MSQICYANVCMHTIGDKHICMRNCMDQLSMHVFSLNFTDIIENKKILDSFLGIQPFFIWPLSSQQR